MSRPHLGLALTALAACNDAAPPATPTNALPSLTPDPGELRGCITTAPAPGRSRALRVSCPEQRPRGPLAMARAGDVVLENSVARFFIRGGEQSATTVGAPGGGVIDAVPQGDFVDGVKEILPALNLHGLAVGPLVIVRSDGPEAVVRAEFTPRPLDLVQAVIPLPAQQPALRGVVEYALRHGSNTLRIRACAVPHGETGTTSVRPGAVAFLGGAQEVIAPGSGVLDGDMASGSGPFVVTEGPSTAVGIGLEAPATIVHAGTVTLFDSTTRVQFAEGVVTCTELRVAVAPTAASIYDALQSDRAAPEASATPPTGGRAEFVDAQGRVLLRSRAAADGSVRAHLRADAARTRAARPNGLFGPAAMAPATGTLVVNATVRGAAGAPVRVTAVRDDEAVEQRFVVTGEARRVLPTGRYRVSASRGMEHTAVTSDVTIAADAEVRFTAELERVVDTRGYVATDFHLHTELSTDSVHPVGDAVRQMAGEGLEVVAGTDHDFVTDLPAVVTASGVSDWLVAVPGVEVSTVRLGHYGGYPLRRDESRAGANAVPWFGLSPAQIARELRSRGDDVIVQVNHPRLRGTGVFDQIGLDAATGMARGNPAAVGLPAGTDLTELAFDVVEVWNGYTRGDNERSFTDWLALRAAGRRFLMVGNSDSHRPDKPPGAPRSFVRVPDDAPGRAGWEAVRAGLRGGDVSVGAGLFVEASTDGGVRPGGRAVARDGRVMLRVRVQAPPWAECTRVRIYRGTEVVVDRRFANAPERVVRFDEVLPVEVPRESFVVVRADGEHDAQPVFDWNPIAVTNPIDVAPR